MTAPVHHIGAILVANDSEDPVVNIDANGTPIITITVGAAERLHQRLGEILDALAAARDLEQRVGAIAANLDGLDRAVARQVIEDIRRQYIDLTVEAMDPAWFQHYHPTPNEENTL